MTSRWLVLSLLFPITILLADSSVRREPSLFLEYERAVAKMGDSTENESNPFKKILSPITPKPTEKHIAPPVEIVKVQPPLPKPAIGEDDLPYLVINKPVSASNITPISCPNPEVTVSKPDDKSKKTLFENMHSIKDRIMARAKALLGTPYGYGDKGASQTDCSGFTQQVFSQFGISLPHSAAEQAAYGKEVSNNDLQVGDLMFYHTYKDEPSHVAIYAGEGQIIHASYRNRRVQYDSIDKGYYKDRFMYAKRLALNNSDNSNE